MTSRFRAAGRRNGFARLRVSVPRRNGTANPLFVTGCQFLLFICHRAWSTEPLADIGKAIPVVLDEVARPVTRLCNEPVEALAVLVSEDPAPPLSKAERATLVRSPGMLASEQAVSGPERRAAHRRIEHMIDGSGAYAVVPRWLATVRPPELSLPPSVVGSDP